MNVAVESDITSYPDRARWRIALRVRRAFLKGKRKGKWGRFNAECSLFNLDTDRPPKQNYNDIIHFLIQS